MFKLREKERSLKGAHGLIMRIKSINSDCSTIMEEYEKQGAQNAAAAKACLEQIDDIVPHHCDQHYNCKYEKWCSYLKVKNEHPDWPG